MGEAPSFQPAPQPALPQDAQEQGQTPEPGARLPPLARAGGDDAGVGRPGDVLAGVVELVGHVAEHREPAHHHILLLWGARRPRLDTRSPSWAAPSTPTAALRSPRAPARSRGCS